jgi:hypothetical protein
MDVPYPSLSPVGLTEADDARYAVYFGELLLGYLDARTPGSL